MPTVRVLPCPPLLVRVTDHVDHDAVGISDEEASYAPGFVGEWVDNLVTAALRLRIGGVNVAHSDTEQRLLGARETLAAAGIPLPPTLVAHGDFSYSAGARSGRAWLTLPAGERPTAIVCANDAMAIGVLSAVASLGLRVPEDVSVTGYDDVPQAQFTVPPLTTVAQPLDEMAEEAIVRLLGRIECPADAPPTYHYIFPVRLIERSSSARLRSVAPSG